MDNTAYRKAAQQVQRKIGFFMHLTVYIAVNSGLILFNLLAWPDRLSAFSPLFGWGVGLLFHGLAVFLHAPGAAWKQRLIEKEMKKFDR